ncbi:type VII secretion protein EsaA, partial [Mammaliicoccus sciuri]
MLVDEVIQDMSEFKSDKSVLLKQIDQLHDTSHDLVDEMMEGQKGLLDNQQGLSELIKELEETHKKIEENPKKPEIDKGKEEEFVTLSTELDKNVQSLSEKSTQLLSDSQKSQSTANTVSAELNQLDRNAG